MEAADATGVASAKMSPAAKETGLSPANHRGRGDDLEGQEHREPALRPQARMSRNYNGLFWGSFAEQ
jgi:hypothetical protein